MTTKNSNTNPYKVILSQHVTEKTMTLAGLADADSNPCLRRCESPKAVFIVDPKATKPQIKDALEEIYAEQGITVVKVNTINVPRKARRVRGRRGFRAGYKKAVVTLEAGDKIENV